MFFTKTQPITDTMQDKKVKELAYDISEESARITDYATKVIVRNGAIELYPEGADKEKAKKDAQSARMLLLSAIGVYDDLIRQYKEALASNYERVTTLHYSAKYLTSHEIVENVYKNFYTRG